ncbi:hypothetical protein N7527_006493 [Penicillium freii]|nr:hypothetical protein N7527_006493 [Penicillium freii]
MIYRRLFRTLLPTVREELMMIGARITNVTDIDAPLESVLQSLSVRRKREDLGKRLEALTSDISCMLTTINDVRNEANRIERAVTVASEVTSPSPIRQRVDVSLQTENSTSYENTPFAVRSEVTLVWEVISIVSLPDPII